VTQGKPRILIADDEPRIREAITLILEREGYAVLVAEDGQEAFEIGLREQPDLVLLDVMMPRMDGFEACHRLRAHYRTRHIPILMLTANANSVDNHIQGFDKGANDYVSKPYEFKEVVKRIERHLNWAKTQRAVSPLTGLPGNLSIQTERQRRVDSGERFAQMLLDIDSFKSFNDRYGFSRGDTAITAVADVLAQVIETQGHAGDFVGHIGGDDFTVITELDRVEELAEAMKQGLQERMPQLYDEEDRALGYVRVLNRRHEFEDFPLMSVTIAHAAYDPATGMHLAQLDDQLRELKEYGKSLPGFVVVSERRRSHPEVAPETPYGSPPKLEAEPPAPRKSKAA